MWANPPTRLTLGTPARHSAVMDTVALSFYAVVCAALAFASPLLGNPVIRILAGAIVGAVSAVAIGPLRQSLGY